MAIGDGDAPLSWACQAEWRRSGAGARLTTFIGERVNRAILHWNPYFGVGESDGGGGECDDSPQSHWNQYPDLKPD
ncbi:hypothetical protein PF010_g4592 [Phytophthora fragariae]|uniref:Uncharacterized protein n=1 Tax=Phytophthora fragariae TaxID=53985 RepID=A0A6G0LQR7_9STRA|nr:hypothetical protein PF010_g4592 [Phytophthora fragariae]